MNEDDVLDIQDNDVVIVLRPQYKDGEWDGSISIIQSASDCEVVDNGVRAAAVTAIAMTMLPSLFEHDPSFKEKIFAFIHDHHPEAMEAFMSRYVFDKE